VEKNKAAGRILLNDEITHGEGHGVPREDVVTTEDVLPIYREASARYYCQDTLAIIQSSGVILPGHACVGLVRLGEDSHEHGEGSIVVENTK